MRPAMTVLLRMVLVILLDVIVVVAAGSVLVFGGLSAVGQSWNKPGAGDATWYLALGIAAIMPAVGALLLRQLIRAAGATLFGTLAGAYAGAAAAIAFVYWTTTHSMGFHFENLRMVVTGLGSGAFLGATYRDPRSRSELSWAETRWLDLAAAAVVLVIAGMQAFGIVERGLHDPLYVRTRIAREGASSEPAGPAPRVLWRTGADFDRPLLAAAPDGRLYRAEPYELVSILATGGNDWRRQSENDYDDESLAAVAENGAIYAAHNGVLESYGPDGALRWRVPSGGRITGLALGANQTVYVSAGDGTKAALAAIDGYGHEKWRVLRDGRSGSVAIGADGTIYDSGTTLRAFREDGTLRWQTAPATFNFNAIAIGNDGTIYAEVAFEGLRAFSSAGKELWSFDGRGYTVGRSGSTFTPLVGRDGTIYAAADNLYALSPNGTLRWAWRAENPLSNRRTAAILGDGTIVVASERGILYGVTPQGTTRWKYADSPPDQVAPLPLKDLTVAPDGTLRIHYASQILALDAGSGALARDGWPLPRHDPWNSARAGAAYVIPPPKSPAPSAYTKLTIAKLQSETQQTRIMAAEMLARSAERRSDEVVDALAAASKHPDPITRGAAIARLGRIDSPRAIPAIVAALDDSDPTVRAFAAGAAAKTHGAAAAAVPKLIPLLHTPADAANRNIVLLALGMMGRDAEAAIPDIEPLRTDPDRNVAESAKWAIAQISGSRTQH